MLSLTNRRDIRAFYEMNSWLYDTKHFLFLNEIKNVYAPLQL